MNKVLKLVAVGALALVVFGCASVGGVAQKYANNDKVEGTLYGAGLYFNSKNEDNAKMLNEACEAIGNKDARCLDRGNYKIIGVCSRFGYADAFTGTFAFAPKEMDLGETCVSGSKDCTYLKAKVEKGKLGTVLEVASRPGDGKCHWSGMPRAGGTVCPAYNYDSSRDFNGIPR